MKMLYYYNEQFTIIEEMASSKRMKDFYTVET